MQVKGYLSKVPKLREFPMRRSLPILDENKTHNRGLRQTRDVWVDEDLTPLIKTRSITFSLYPFNLSRNSYCTSYHGLLQVRCIPSSSETYKVKLFFFIHFLLTLSKTPSVDYNVLVDLITLDVEVAPWFLPTRLLTSLDLYLRLFTLK